jgi:hypothetical protein
MEKIFVVQLVAVVGLLIGLGFFISVAVSMRRTMREMERTLHSLCGEILGLMPRVSTALQQLERTGEEVGKTAASSATLLNRLNGKAGASAVLDGAARFLPAAVLLARLVGPLVSRLGSGRRKDS